MPQKTPGPGHEAVQPPRSGPWGSDSGINEQLGHDCSLNGIRAVIFDAVGTLIYPVEGIAETYRRVIGGVTGCDIDRQLIAQVVGAALSHRSNCVDGRDLMSSETEEREFWFQLIQRLCPEPEGVPQCFEALFEYFAMPSAWRCFADTEAVLEACGKSGRAVALGSNFDRRLHQICDGLPELNRISRRLISTEIGWRKPSREFYFAAAKALDCQPHEILMVGDDFENDAAGACRAGLRAVWLNRLPADATSGIPVSMPTGTRVVSACDESERTGHSHDQGDVQSVPEALGIQEIRSLLQLAEQLGSCDARPRN